MKKFSKILRYIIPYWPKALLSVTLNLFGIMFSLFSLSLIIPFLGILFNTQDIVHQSVPLTFSAESIITNFKYLLSQVIIEYGKVSALVFVSLIVVVATLLKNGFLYMSAYYLSPIRNGVIKDIRNELFAKILELPLGFFSDERKGDIISRMTADVNEIEVSIIRSLDLFFREPMMIIVYLGSLIFMSPQLTLFVAILLPVSGIVIGRIGRSLRKTSFKGQRRMGILLSIIDETLGGLRIIKAFNAENKMNQRFQSTNSFYARLMIKMWRRRDLASPLSEFLGISVMVLVMWYGGTLVLNHQGSLSPEGFIGYLAIFSQLINPAKSFTTAYYNVLKGMASSDRIDAILSAENNIKEKPDAVTISDFKEAIEYRNVSFKYDRDEVLKNINLRIEKGKTVALVGQSGSGKSTLADLLPRFYDVMEGEILIDGVNIKDYKIKDLRNLMGNVNQESILFNDSFYNNIAFSADFVKEADIIHAAKVANAHDFIEATRYGYYSNVGDRGGKLSGGQRQRVSIARAVLKNPPILILDEATSALDTESERLVQDALFKLMENRTSLVIAHRLSTVQHADEICVLHEGEIIERGKHDELIAKNGVYKKLHDLQMFS